MKTVGLIAEYNPFHNGHKYHIEEAKHITGADYAIVVMSGNFVQRGTPAIIDKYSRAEMALRNGADLVLELPVCYATGSAEYFARGAVALLDQLGVVDYLCFGSEAGDIKGIMEAAGFLSTADPLFEDRLQAFLRDGLTYPAARQKALQHSLAESGNSEGQALSNILSEPNNILGMEYVKAIRYFSSAIEPVTIQRLAAHYHEENLSAALSGGPSISSATAIRKAILNTDFSDNPSFEMIRHSVPETVYDTLADRYQKYYPITVDAFAQCIRYKLLSEDAQTLRGYLDVSSDLADRMKNLSDYDCTIAELAQKLKTKNVTLTRINRVLIHLLLNIRTASVEEYNHNGYSQYARVLGMKKESSRLLRSIEKAGRVPVITRVPKAAQKLSPLGIRMLFEDIFATHLYHQVVFEKFKTKLPNEYRHGILII